MTERTSCEDVELWPERRQAWLYLVSTDDAGAGLEMFKNFEPRPWRDVLINEAMCAHVFPKALMTAIAESGELHDKWLLRAIYESDKIDWKTVLSWREEQAGTAAAREEIGKALFEAFLEYVSRDRNQKDQSKHATFLLGLLEYDPSLASINDQMADEGSTIGLISEASFFELSAHKDSGNWLARSGLDIRSVLYSAVCSNRTLALLKAEDKGDMDAGLTSWLNRHPSHQHAWDQLRIHDESRLTAHQDWTATWLPSQQWNGSPIQRWSNGESVLGGASPFDHPLFELPLKTVEDAISRQDIQKHYLKSMERARKTKRDDVFAMKNANEIIFREAGQQLGVQAMGLLVCPLDPSAMRLLNGLVSASEAARTTDGAMRLQNVLEDERTHRGLAQYNVRAVCDWVLTEPSWQSWRNEQGDSVLDIFARHTSQGSAKITKSVALQLAKTCPDILTTRGSTGETVLNKIEINGDGRAAAERLMLKNRRVKHGARAARPAM